MKGSWGFFMMLVLLTIWQPSGCSSRVDGERTLRQAVVDYIDRLSR